MNRQRKILITVIYNDLGIIVDTKAEEFDLSANLQQTCNQLATNTISRQAAIDESLRFIVEYYGAAFDEEMQVKLKRRLESLPSAQPETTTMILGQDKDGIRLWYKCSNCGEPCVADDNYCSYCGRRFVNHG